MSFAITAQTFYRGPSATALLSNFVTDLAARLKSWRYEGGKRDARLDLLRGFAALAMIADHVSGNSWLVPFTGGNRFLVSAAEAFVFISGALVGLVYGKAMLKNGAGSGMLKALKRASKLYFLTVILTLAFALTGRALGLWWQPEANSAPAQFIFETLTLQRTVFLADIMLMYTLLLLVAAPALFLLAHGHTKLVLAASFSIWGLWQVSPGILCWQITNNDVFILPAWQVVFVLGMVLGFHRAAIESWIARLSRPALIAGLVTLSAFALGLYAVQLMHIEALRANDTLYALGFDKANMPAGRLVAFALFGSFAFALLTLAWTPVRNMTGWLLLPLGENALTAYSVHLAVVAVTTKAQLLLGADMSTAGATIMQVVAVLAVWSVIKVEPTAKRAVVDQLAALRERISMPARSSGADLGWAPSVPSPRMAA